MTNGSTSAFDVTRAACRSAKNRVERSRSIVTPEFRGVRLKFYLCENADIDITFS